MSKVDVVSLLELLTVSMLRKEVESTTRLSFSHIIFLGLGLPFAVQIS